MHKLGYLWHNLRFLAYPFFAMTTEKTTTPLLTLKDRFRGFYPVVIDVETGGLNSATDALLEIAICTLKMDAEGFLHKDQCFHAHIEPFEGAILNPDSMKINSIDVNDPNRQARCELEALQEMFRIIRHGQKQAECQRSIIVAHNASFDHGFIMSAVERSGVKRNPFHPFATIDTASLAGLIFGQTVLFKACQMANIPFDNKQAHSALYDTERTAELFCYMVNFLQGKGLFPHPIGDC